jgi:hypothetical protein
MYLREKMEKLRRSDYTCDDCWYSCPKSGDWDYCGEESRDICNCGADDHNATLDEILLANP